MILADKIINLRKKNGWSQEELADKMDVSRQAVSKWEGAQSVPDLDKIVQLSALFGVSTDYLLKDEFGEEVSEDEKAPETRRISLDEATKYIELRRKASWQIAVATFLCVLSPIALLLFGALSEYVPSKVSETLAGAVGLSALFFFVLCAVPLFIYCGYKNSPYEFLEKNVAFVLERPAKDYVLRKKEEFNDTYIKCNIVATCICIFAPLPLIISAFTEKELLIAIMLNVTIALAGVGAFIFIVAGVRNACLQKLLKEGDYTSNGKKKTKTEDTVGGIYWGIIVAIFLVWSFLTNDWHITWLVFAVGGVLYPVLMSVINLCADKKNKD